MSFTYFGAKRIEYKEAIRRFGRRRLSIFEVFLGLHRKREAEEGGTEPVFVNVYGAQKSIPRNRFRQPTLCSLAGLYDKRVSYRPARLRIDTWSP